jgi:NADP-dependent 3-hydroxy acid dehydrogenase YdfG
MPGGGQQAQAVSLDVAERAAVLRAAEALLGQWGRVDILVNNAGLNIPRRRLDELKGEDWDRVILANLTGAYNMIAAVLPPMRAQGDGLIVNVSSIAGKRASGLSGAAYTASKHGMNGLNDSINIEEWSHGIRATAICPGEVSTEILEKRPIPVDPEDRARMIAPEDLVEAIRFVSALPPRTTVTEMLVMPTHKRALKPEELG